MGQDEVFADAVAIVGMSCRFAPDLDSPEKYWAFLAEGSSAVSRMPDRRWEPYASASPQATAILRRTTRLGSFLKDIEGFDAEFFGISPREADFLDPQQRIVLELAWEALERSGIPPLSLSGTDAGIFVAANSNDYGRRLLEDIPRTGAWAVNGTTYYGIANRISYFLDLHGPSIAVDTACAGSLTALHLACQSLRAAEIPVAVVAGVNIMASPALNVALDAAGAMAPDGRSKAFDKAADGYGRGEGAGVVVLKRWEDARRDGDEVLALILGGGVFQDGRSDGMMAPNSAAQEHMLRRAYRRAGITPDTVSYVEAHGTGTPVGDREEALALAGVFGAGRPPRQPCLIGSVKPNIGHTEAGSGIAGVIKTVLALRHEEIPASLHTEPNPEFDWRGSGLRLVAELSPWPSADRPRRAGVSSYGVGGTIAHLILQEAPASPRPLRPAPPAVTGSQLPSVFPLSAMADAGLRALAGTLADWLDRAPGLPLASVGHTLSRRRSHLAMRAAVVAGSTTELVARLRTLAAGQRTSGISTARAGQRSGPVWVFSGHGAQWSGMGRQLLDDEPVFGATMDRLAGVFRDELGWTPRQMLSDGGPWTASQVQALTFAVQVGLAEVWRRHGVAPAAVIGHSVGEIAAAVAAGCLDLVDAARFACRRAKALHRLGGLGGMAMVELPFPDVQGRLVGRDDVVAAIAASPRSTVISGDRDAVERLTAAWREEGIRVRTVDTDIAFHSSHVAAAARDVADAAGALAPRPARIPLYTTALPDPRSTVARDAQYWVANLCQPVRFAAAVEAAVRDGHRLFLEISSHPVVTHSIVEVIEQVGVEDAAALHSLRRDQDELRTLLGSLAELHCLGAPVDWSRTHPGGGLVDLPTMAWQHRPYWIFSGGQADAAPGAGHDPDQHTLLGGRLTVSGAPPRQVWQTYLDLSCRPYPQDHEVVGVEITPAAVIINSFAAAAGRGGHLPGLTDIVLRTPLAVTPARVVQIVLAENTVRLATRVVREDSTDDEEYEWITHSTASIDWAGGLPSGRVDVPTLRDRCPQEWSWVRVDDMFRRMGVGGYAFPWDVEELRRSEQEQMAVLTIEAPPARRATSWAHVIDGALTISAVLVTPEYAKHQWMSSHIDSVVFRGDPPARITVHSVRAAQSPQDTVDVLVADERGEIVCQVRGLRFSPIQQEDVAVAVPQELVHEVVWRPIQPTAAIEGQQIRQAVVVGSGTAADRLGELLDRAGVRCGRITSPEELTPAALAECAAVVVAPDRPRAGESPEQAAERCAWTVVRTAQRVAAAQGTGGDGASPRLWCLTRGVRHARQEQSLAHAPLWGICRIFAGEHPQSWGGVVDLVDDDDTAPLDGDLGRSLVTLMSGAAGTEDVISLGADGPTTARLSPVGPATTGSLVQCQPTGTYLITGGLGALGLEVARWLVDRGARRLLLAGRHALPPRADWDRIDDSRTRRQIEGVRALEALGATVRTLELDITDADGAAAALDPAVHGLPPIRGIVHAAGTVHDAMLANVDADGLHDVLRPKAYGGMVLHRLFPPGSVDFLVFFSSCGQFARLTGQTSYAAANSFLDTLAVYRHVGGHTDTISLGWTSWRGVGMSGAIASTMLEANSRGLAAISVTEAFRAWAYADRFRLPYQAVLRVLPVTPGSTRPPMFRDLTATTSAADQQDGQGVFAIDWAGLPVAELREQVVVDVREQVAAELNLMADDVEVKRPLVELGIDSVMTVTLRVRMQRRYGVDLPPTILWNRPTVVALADDLIERLRPQPTDGASAAGPVARSAHA